MEPTNDSLVRILRRCLAYWPKSMSRLPTTRQASAPLRDNGSINALRLSVNYNRL